MPIEHDNRELLARIEELEKELAEDVGVITVLRRQRDKAEAALDRVRSACLADDDGTEYEHNHPFVEGEPECPACWAEEIREAASYPA